MVTNYGATFLSATKLLHLSGGILIPRCWRTCLCYVAGAVSILLRRSYLNVSQRRFLFRLSARKRAVRAWRCLRFAEESEIAARKLVGGDDICSSPPRISLCRPISTS